MHAFDSIRPATGGHSFRLVEWLYTYKVTLMNVVVWLSLHAFISHVHIAIHTYIHTYTHIHTHTYTHT